MMTHLRRDIRLLADYPTPKKKPIIGQYCELHPLDATRHARPLYQVFLLDHAGVDWTYLPYGPFHSESEFVDWITKTCLTDDPLFYTICVGKSLEPVGLVSLLKIEPKHGKLEIGHVHFSPKLQHTAAGTEALYLLMKLVFESMGYRRLEWKCDHANERSKYCALRLGFTFEGIFRQHWIVKARNRDTAWFSVLDSEWDAIQQRCERWLHPTNFNVCGNQVKKLSECV